LRRPEAVATAAADSYARIVAALIRVTGDWTLAEEQGRYRAVSICLEAPVPDLLEGNPSG